MGNSFSAAMMPTTRSAGRGTDRSARPVASSDGVTKGTRITEPMRTPLSWASVKDASTSPGSDWCGIRPERSVTSRGSCRSGATETRKLLVSIGVRQDAQRGLSLIGTRTGVTDATSGSPASCGSGRRLYTMMS